MVFEEEKENSLRLEVLQETEHNAATSYEQCSFSLVCKNCPDSCGVNYVTQRSGKTFPTRLFDGHVLLPDTT